MKTQRFPSILLIAVVLIFTLTAVGCGSKAAGPTVVQVKLNEYNIVMDQTSIPAGPVRFEIENIGTEEHEFVIEAAGAHDEPFELNGKASEAETIQPGGKATLEWTLDQAGDYQAACYTKNEGAEKDHAEQGMVMAFTVTNP
jgi:uncharacterized cupredoxin-like copper-binding protein